MNYILKYHMISWGTKVPDAMGLCSVYHSHYNIIEAMISYTHMSYNIHIYWVHDSGNSAGAARYLAYILAWIYSSSALLHTISVLCCAGCILLHTLQPLLPNVVLCCGSAAVLCCRIMALVPSGPVLDPPGFKFR
jgi:hypothetical protein